MKPSSNVLLLVILLAWITGCMTTGPIRTLATSVDTELDGYIKDRKAAIAALNSEYRATYAALLQQHGDLSGKRLQLERRVAARGMADAMLLSWSKKTTFTSIAADLSAARAEQMRAIDAAAEAIAEARRTYAKSYTELKLELKKLEAAKSKLAKLSESDRGGRATLDFLITVAKAYNDVREKDEGTQ